MKWKISNFWKRTHVIFMIIVQAIHSLISVKVFTKVKEEILIKLKTLLTHLPIDDFTHWTCTNIKHATWSRPSQVQFVCLDLILQLSPWIARVLLHTTNIFTQKTTFPILSSRGSTRIQLIFEVKHNCGILIWLLRSTPIE